LAKAKSAAPAALPDQMGFQLAAIDRITLQTFDPSPDVIALNDLANALKRDAGQLAGLATG
jgi:hypothetical protein